MVPFWHAFPCVSVITQLAGVSSCLSVLSIYWSETGRSVQWDNTCLHWTLHTKVIQQAAELKKFGFLYICLSWREGRETPQIFLCLVFGVLLLPWLVLSFNGSFISENIADIWHFRALQPSDFNFLWLRLINRVKNYWEGWGAIRYIYNGLPLHKHGHMEDVISRFSYY